MEKNFLPPLSLFKTQSLRQFSGCARALPGLAGLGLAGFKSPFRPSEPDHLRLLRKKNVAGKFKGFFVEAQHLLWEIVLQSYQSAQVITNDIPLKAIYLHS